MSFHETRHFDEKETHFLTPQHKHDHHVNPEYHRVSSTNQHEPTLFSKHHQADSPEDISSPEQALSSPRSEGNKATSLTISVDRKFEPYEIKLATKKKSQDVDPEATDHQPKMLSKVQSPEADLPQHPRTFKPVEISARPGPLNRALEIPEKEKFKPRSSGYVDDIHRMLQRIVNNNQHQPAKSYHLKKLDKNQLVQELIKQKKLRVPKEVEVKKYHHKFGDFGVKKVKRMGTGKFNYGTPQDDIRDALDYIEGEKELARIEEEQEYLLKRKLIPRPTISNKKRGSSVKSALHGLEHGSSKPKRKPSRRHVHASSVNEVTSPIRIERINSDKPSSSVSTDWVNVVKNIPSETKQTSLYDDPDLSGEPLNDPSTSQLDNMTTALTQVASKISAEVMNWMNPSEAQPQ